MENRNKVRKLKSLRLKIEAKDIKELKIKAIHDQQYEMAAHYRDKEKIILEQIDEIEKEILWSEIGFD